MALHRAEQQHAERPQIGGGADRGCQPPVLMDRSGLLGCPPLGDGADHDDAGLAGPFGGERGGGAADGGSAGVPGTAAFGGGRLGALLTVRLTGPSGAAGLRLRLGRGRGGGLGGVRGAGGRLDVGPRGGSRARRVGGDGAGPRGPGGRARRVGTGAARFALPASRLPRPARSGQPAGGPLVPVGSRGPAGSRTERHLIPVHRIAGAGPRTRLRRPVVAVRRPWLGQARLRAVVAVRRPWLGQAGLRAVAAVLPALGVGPGTRPRRFMATVRAARGQETPGGTLVAVARAALRPRRTVLSRTGPGDGGAPFVSSPALALGTVRLIAGARRALRHGGRGLIRPRLLGGGGLGRRRGRGRRNGVVAAQRLFRRARRQPHEHRAAVVAQQHRSGGDVAVDPAMGVQGAQRRKDVVGDLGGAVRGQRALRQQRGQRTAGDQFADDPQASGLREDMEDLAESRMVGDLRGGRRRRDGAPDGRITAAPGRTPGTGERAGPPRGPAAAPPRVLVDDFGVDDLRQRYLPQMDFLAAVGVEGAGLDEFVPHRRVEGAGDSGRPAPGPRTPPRRLPKRAINAALISDQRSVKPSNVVVFGGFQRLRTV
ncbi:hypothetical protein SANTM175S_09968 [Streptomyces antimycoticus]